MHLKFKLLLQLSLLELFSTAVESRDASAKYIAVPELGVKGVTELLTSVNATSRLKCAIKCNRIMDCVFSIWYQDSKNCETYSWNETGNGFTGIKTPFLGSEVS